jgi:hypothetical protein
MIVRVTLALAALLSAAPALSQSQAEKDIRKGIQGTGKYGAAGCGLGSMAFDSQPGGIQIIAATLNGICGNQTFGITFGTSNCQPGALAQGTKSFVEANREALAKDIARGEGEAIGALTVINACADSRKVGSALKARFGAIFPSDQASNDDVTRAILDTLHADASLGCGRG